MSISVDEVQAIYDRAYTHPGLMGTQFDLEYSRVTKSTLLEMCHDAPNPRLLDMGTGDGDLWQFVPSNLEGYALDISEVGTKRAVHRFPHVNVKGAVAIAEGLPYREQFFGSVIAADTIEHLFDIQLSLHEIRRLLVPNGKFSLSVPTPNSLQTWAMNRFLRQLPSLSMLARLLWVVIRRTLLFGHAAFQPIDRDLSLP
jgi:ubiquinone/menaquinone biosynthesis C-methylase UbiE